MDPIKSPENFEGFDWDSGNELKSRDKHGVSKEEAEQPFFNRPLIIADDLAHSQSEPRYLVLGRTNAGRLLFVAFTTRGRKIRVISARDMSRREREAYKHEEKDAKTED